MKFVKLTIDGCKKTIPKNTTGVYFLGIEINKNIHLKYIGRSDTRLRNRLLEHAKAKKYTHFSFQLTKTIFEAYRIECREWHNAIDLDNRIHPKKPKKLGFKCPYCTIEKGGYKKWKIKNKE